MPETECTSNNIDKLIVEVIEREGGYVNDPSDRGGATRFGITEAVARRAKYTGTMSELPESLARHIYKSKYWYAPQFDKLSVTMPIAEELFDCGVNMGPRWAAKFLQESMNLFSPSIPTWPTLKVDGTIGPVTISAMNSFNFARRNLDGADVMLFTLRALRGARYIKIAQKSPDQRRFIYGWLRRMVELGKDR